MIMDRNTSPCTIVASIEPARQDHPLASHGSLPCRGRVTVTAKVTVVSVVILQ